jgi:drug/metabolite transporter (DMT)-like permease
MSDHQKLPPDIAASVAGSATPVMQSQAVASGPDRTGMAILIMCVVAFIFSLQDGFSRVLAENYSPLFVVMIRYWFFALFVIALVARQPGGLKRAIRTKRPITQTIRGVLLVAEVVIMVEAFVRLGLVETHAVFACAPLLVAGLSGPVLGEKVGWRRWMAIGIGFLGIIVVLDPGGGVMSVQALLPFAAALMFALYGLLTRHVARDDPSMVSFFWTGVTGAIAITVVGIWHWEWMAPMDWVWMLGLCLCGMSSHYLMIRAYEMAEASALQPFAYTQLVWVSFIGVLIFGETLRPNVVVGASIVVLAGLFTLWRTRVKAKASGPA